MSRVVVFIDTQNLYHTVREKFNAKPNYKALLKFIKTHVGTPYATHAYGAQVAKEANGFIHALTAMGVTTHWKQAFIHKSTKGDTCKADNDAEMFVDIFKEMERFDTIVLLTADSDFTPLIQFLENRDKTVIVVGCKPSGRLKSTVQTTLEITEDLTISGTNNPR